MKTPEELAEERVEKLWEDSGTEFERICCHQDFLAGYQAAKEHAHAALEEAEAEIDRLQTKLSDAGILTTEHLIDASKMVSSSATLNNWISVKNRLPKDGTSVLVTRGGPGCTTATYFEKSGFYNGHLEDVVITHWMPLPKPPEK